MKTVPQIRVFLASPGDVNEERAIALEVLDMLEHDRLFKRNGAGGVSIHAIAWDKPGSGTAMRASKTPQTAIKEGLPRPSECDIVLVLFWGRMGTELPYPEYQKPDGSKFLSGTEWEFTDAITAEREHGKPITLLYRRTEEPDIDMSDRKAVAQYHAMLDFFDQFRDTTTGALLGGVNEYGTPEAFRQMLTNNLRDIIDDILTNEGFTDSPAPSSSSDRPLVEAPPLWPKSPFPGLRAFTESDAPIFFGRGLETSELIKRVEASRFTAVVAASGSGKSSLVAAGLIPRLKANVIVNGDTGSKDWRFVRFTPGQSESPFAALFDALCETFPEHAVSPFLIEQEKQGFVTSVTSKPAAFVEVCEALLREAKAPAWAEILFFVDQFEELFTNIPDERADERTAFVALLEAIHSSRRMRCIVTMRSDFYANCLELPALAALLKDATYPLAAPTAGALIEMIKRPAERADLTWEEGLPERIQADTGNGAGALALMAYALDELYDAAHGHKRLTFKDYHRIDGVEGAIGKRAETTYAGLTIPDKESVFQRVFRELVTVDERGTATRQRTALGKFDLDEQVLVKAFTNARLLVTHDNVVEVAHEALFRSWERLKTWIAETQEDLILLRQVRNSAHDWQTKGRPDFLRWPQERLVLVYAMQERLMPELNEVERDFIEPEQNRLLREIAMIATDHKRRRWIGERLATIGDIRTGIALDERGLPQIDWLPVRGSGEPVVIKTDELEIGPVTIPDFYFAKYLITYQQFQAFLDAPDGFEDKRWCDGMPDDYKRQAMGSAVAQYANYPRDSVSWYQSVAFSRWMNYRCKGLKLVNTHDPKLQPLIVGENAVIRLPTEWEWQWMAQAGTSARKYPWGEWDDKPRANTTEAGIGDRSTAVGMYPHGTADCGALDVAGNLWEWCLNDRRNPEVVDGYVNGEPKVLRGGSFTSPQNYAATPYRNLYHLPAHRPNSFGLRLAVCPIASLPSESLDSESE